MSTTIETKVDPCAPYTFELWDNSSGKEVTLDTDVFSTIDLTSETKTLGVKMTNSDQVGLHELKLYVYYQDYPDSMASIDFLIMLTDTCITSVSRNSAFNPPSLSYIVSEPAVFFNSEIAASWTTEPTDCFLEYRVSVPAELMDPNAI